MPIIIMSEYGLIDHPMVLVIGIDYPHIFRRKKGDYVLPFRPSVRPSTSSLPASSPTLLMLESPNLYAWYPYDYRWWQHIWNHQTYMHDTPMLTDGGNIFEIFHYFQFWNYSDFIDFTPYCNFSGNLSRNWFKFFKCMGGCHIHHISNGFYCMTFRSPLKWKYRWRGRILKENCLLPQFISISYTIDARITKPMCMMSLCIQMVAMYLKFFYIFQF